MKTYITKDMGITEAVQTYPDVVPVFQALGMHCFGCMAAQFENLEQGCLAHGLDPDSVVRAANDELNRINED